MLSDFERAQLASPGTPDTELVVGLVEDTLGELGLAPPINHDIVASYRDILRIEPAEIPWSGQIVPTESGLVVSVRAGDSWRRQRFTIFHEILHTYMRGFHLQPHYRCDPQSSPPDVVRDAGLEQLCDAGAAEMLLPRAALLEDMVGNRVDLDLVESLADHYQASLVATASRVCALQSGRALFITFEPACKPRDPFGEPKLRVQSCYGGRAGTFVPQHKSAADGGVFDRALQGEIVDEIVYLDELTRRPLGRVHVSARLRPYIDDQGETHMRVLALITDPR